MSRLLQQFYAFFDSREAWGGTGVPPGRSATKTKLARIRGLGRKFTLRLTGDGISHFGISCRSFGDAARCRSSAFGKGKGGGRNRDRDRDRDDREGREYRQRKLQYIPHSVTALQLLHSLAHLVAPSHCGQVGPQTRLLLVHLSHLTPPRERPRVEPLLRPCTCELAVHAGDTGA